MKKLTFLLAILFAITIKANSQDSLWARQYQLSGYNQFDLRNSAFNFTTSHRLLNDTFRKEIKSKMGEKSGNITYGLFSFATTYLTILWSHEFGHYLRALQVGGEFRFHNAALPIPHTTMHLPENISLEDEALSVTAGFEVNYLSVRNIQESFIHQNGIYNEDLSLSFAHRLMYPLYTTLIVPVDPEDPEVWINTAGDPVHISLLVFKNYSNDRVFMPDGSVNPELVRYYNQSSIFASLINLFDPQFYRELGGAFGKNKTRRPIFIIGDFENGWTYGTLFNTSPLGYELYMNNYIHVNHEQFSIYVKYGRPFRNNGIGLGWNNLVSNENLNLSVKIEAWDQDLYNIGVSGEFIANIHLTTQIGASLTAGYKTDGYLLGKQLEEGFNWGFGISYQVKY